MKKRSEVVGEAKASLPQGQGYLRCPACDLVQSEASTAPGLKCVNCGEQLDPTMHIEDGSKRSSTLSTKGMAPTCAVEAPPADEKPSTKAKCAECGKSLTETSIGLFYSCGHSPKETTPLLDTIAKAPLPGSVDLEKSIAEKKDQERAQALYVNAKPASNVVPMQSKSIEANLSPMRVRVVWGKELFAPIQFHNFDNGPFEVEIEIPAGADAAAAIRDARAFLRNVAKESFEEKLADYLSRVKVVKSQVRER